MRKLLLGLLSVLLLTLSASFSVPIRVQAAGQPLIMTYKGDLWAWDGSVVKSRTQWGYNFPPVMSPNGASIAYKSTATVAVNGIKQFGYPGPVGELAATVWLLDVASNNAIRIAEQPADASVFNPNVPDYYIVRSDPTWKRDGSALAWTEVTIKGSTASAYRLVTYTVATKQTKFIVPALPKSDNYEGIASIPVKWAEPGLAVMIRHIQMPNQSGSVVIYTEDGQPISTGPNIPNLHDIEWIISGAQVFVAAISPQDGNPNVMQWKLLSPLGGAPMAMQGVPELFSDTAPDGLTIFASVATSTAGWVYSSQLGDIAGSINNVGDSFTFMDRLAISADGMHVAYVDGNNVNVGDQSGLTTAVSNQQIQGLVWGPTRWRVRNGAAQG